MMICFGDYKRYEQERMYLFNSKKEMDMAFIKMFNLTDVQFDELMEHGFTYNTIKYVVVDEASDLWSELYDTKEEAENDLDNDLTYGWSTNAEILEVTE